MLARLVARAALFLLMKSTETEMVPSSASNNAILGGINQYRFHLCFRDNRLRMIVFLFVKDLPAAPAIAEDIPAGVPRIQLVDSGKKLPGRCALTA